MKCFTIFLDTIEKVKNFSAVINKFDGDFDLISGDYVIDAKSIMGIFSLNLKENLKLQVSNVKNINELEKLLKDFM